MTSADVPGLERAEKIIGDIMNEYITSADATMLYKKNMELGFKGDAAFKCLEAVRAELAKARSSE